MNLRKIKTLTFIVGMILVSNSTFAQRRPQVDPSEMGSSAKAAGSFNQNLVVSTRMAIPAYDEVALGQMIEMVAKKYARGFDPLEINLEAINKYYQIKANPEGEAQEPDFSYQISKKSGRIYLHRDRSSIKPYSMEQGTKEMRMAYLTHPELLKNFGIDKSQLLFLKPNLVLLDGIEKLQNGGFGKPEAALVDNIFTYGQRSIEGIMIEGSYVKVISKDARTLESLVINWPRFQIHPGIGRFDVKSKSEILEEAIKHLKVVVNPKHESNVKMAVVFRPVMMGESRVFVPALKIGLYSRPIGVSFADEKGENGEMFYVDLMKQPVKYTDKDESDNGAST